MGIDFAKIGLKAGLEVHQQLETGKLFCRCPSILREDSPDIIFRRKLRAVASELGEFDAAALEAFKKGQTFEYQTYSDTTCLIEADECPPKPCDKEALEITLEIALMAKSKILDELVVMRKAVIDGSNTSAFQRTMLVAIGGELKLKNKTINVQTIALEEDAARPIEKRDREIVYRLDRLGIPLVELATAPDLKTPEEVKECALKIGELFRRTCRAKRGLGTIRQDLNVSIANGSRVEIKGVQQLELIDEYVRREAQRQVSLLELKEEIKKRGLKKEEIALQQNNVSEIFRESECKFLKGKNVFGTKVNGFSGLIGKEIQPDRRFGTELASYVKAKVGLKGIVHSDELPAYGISQQEVEKLRQAFNCGEKDAFIILQAEKETAEKAFRAIEERIDIAFREIPEETRNALEDGNTEYSRPLPGAARMYPETDLEPIIIENAFLGQLKKTLPLEVEERLKLYKSKGLSDKLAQEMVLSNSACFFEKLIEKGINATTAAALLLETTIQLKREGIEVSKAMIEKVLLAEKKGNIAKGAFTDILREWGKNPEKGLDEITKKLSFGKAEKKEIAEIIRKIVEANSNIVQEKGMHAIGALMGEAMGQLKGKAAGNEVSALLKAEISKTMTKK